MTSAASISDLATKVGLPAANLAETILRYNELVQQGDDLDFHRFGASSKPYEKETTAVPTGPRVIVKPPFYAMQMFPMTRKSDGGLKVDLSGRVLNAGAKPITGLYAAGEATGSAGMNGKAGLEGVWLGPGVAVGRVAGRNAAGLRATMSEKRSEPPQPPMQKITEAAACVSCHDLPKLIGENRPGYWHFEKVHRTVLDLQKNCLECHAELTPNNERAHVIDRIIQIAACAACHGQ